MGADTVYTSSHVQPREVGRPMMSSLRNVVRRCVPTSVKEAQHLVGDVTGQRRNVAPLPDRIVLGRAARGRIRERGERTLRIRPLNDAPFTIRLGTSDAQVLLDTFVGLHHLPPADLNPRVIWDLGSNMGATVAHYAMTFPQASVVGVEAQPELVDIAKRHVEPWAERCTIISGAVWSHDGELEFACDPGDEFGGHVVDQQHPGQARYKVPALALDSLLRDVETVDFLKVDVEGAERVLFQENTSWASKVRCIKAEVHTPYSLEECCADLQRLGFSAVVSPDHWSCVLARRDSLRGMKG
jgi:FkbM family methyltransferase